MGQVKEEEEEEEEEDGEKARGVRECGAVMPHVRPSARVRV